jgi:hypothetical protein
MVLAHSQLTRKCLKFEYLCQIGYDFQKSRVTGLGTIRKIMEKIFHALLVCLLRKPVSSFKRESKLNLEKRD